MHLRTKLKQALFSILIFTIIVLSISHIYTKKDFTHAEEAPQIKLRRDVSNVEVQNSDVIDSVSRDVNADAIVPTTLRPSTRSLTQLENKKEPSDYVLFFNRVPKCGSEMLVLLLQWLQGMNGFRHIRLPGGERRKLDSTEQERVVEQVATAVRREAVPVSFDRHVYFINFSDFDRQSPIFINLVRDPIDKAISRFYYGRVTPNPLNPDIKFIKSSSTTESPKFDTFEACFHAQDPECNFVGGKSYDLSIPYFCGHDERCMILNDEWAFDAAKRNVEEFFPVVGVLEELNATLSVLEHKLPLFFRGISDMYFNELLEPHKNANRMRPRTIEPMVRSQLRSQLKTEYEFYYWLRTRLLRQFHVT